MILKFARTLSLHGITNCGGHQTDNSGRTCSIEISAVPQSLNYDEGFGDGQVFPAEEMAPADSLGNETCETLALRTAEKTIVDFVKRKPRNWLRTVRVVITNGNRGAAEVVVDAGDFHRVEQLLQATQAPLKESVVLDAEEVKTALREGQPC
jgi:hypothetical protein